MRIITHSPDSRSIFEAKQIHMKVTDTPNSNLRNTGLKSVKIVDPSCLFKYQEPKLKKRHEKLNLTSSNRTGHVTDSKQDTFLPTVETQILSQPLGNTFRNE